jgi:aryl-alcohol dehydrogenase-like predicted oxidoreductase
MSDQPHPSPPGASRREFLQAGAALLAASGVAPAAARADTPAPAPAAPEGEWRNRQPGMAYRRLGRTNLMVSEVVSGGDPITLENYKHLELALEMGLNYLDMAPAYHRGDTERAYGKLLAAAPGRRDRVFLTTKVSGFSQLREGMYDEVFRGLSPSKQDNIVKDARRLRAERGVEAPGYYLTYYPGQQGSFEPAYRRIAMRKEYGEAIEASPRLRDHIVSSLEGSLSRLGTDHVDILMCPHGSCAPEELDGDVIRETFATLQSQGKVRFLGVTAHNDPAGTLRAATAAGHYDVVMMAYNVVNGGYLAEAIRQAHAKGVGMIAMKAAMAVATHHKPLQPVPQWRIDKVERIVPGDLKPPLKAYLWALQNPHLTAVISNLWDETHVRENLGVAGKTVELQSA